MKNEVWTRLPNKKLLRHSESLSFKTLIEFVLRDELVGGRILIFLEFKRLNGIKIQYRKIGLYEHAYLTNFFTKILCNGQQI